MNVAGKAQRLRGRMPAIDPDTPTPVAPSPAAPPASSVAAPAPARQAISTRSDTAVGEQDQKTALQDPGILAGRMGYRSFYVEDSVFARFRAAIYWLSRREDATDDVPENMSVAVQQWMETTATDLENRYNNGKVFRMPPHPKKQRAKPKQ
jgi:hypothetical protein